METIYLHKWGGCTVKFNKIDIRTDSNGLILNDMGEKILAFFSFNDKTKRWDVCHFLGEECTRDDDGNIKYSFLSLLPDEEHYSYNILKSKLSYRVNSDISKLTIIVSVDDSYFGVFWANKKEYVFGFSIGDNFEDDEVYIEEIVDIEVKKI